MRLHKSPFRSSRRFLSSFVNSGFYVSGRRTGKASATPMQANRTSNRVQALKTLTKSFELRFKHFLKVPCLYAIWKTWLSLLILRLCTILSCRKSILTVHRNRGTIQNKQQVLFDDVDVVAYFCMGSSMYSRRIILRVRKLDLTTAER